MNKFKSIDRLLLTLPLVAATSVVPPGHVFSANMVAPQEPPSATAEPVGSALGYGPWQFGMSLEEVMAVEAHAPYEPVRASMGGVETFSGELGDGVASVSFVFNSADQLFLIRVWFDLGDSYQDTLTAFHSSYVHVTEGFGSARFDNGYPLEAGMSAEEFTGLVPDRFAPTGEEFEMGADDAPKDFQMDIRQLRVEPLAQPAGVRVRLLFAKLHPTTGYLVNVFYQSFAHTE